MSGSKSRRRKNNKNKKEKNDASPHKVPELIEPQSNQALQQPDVQIGNKFDGNFERETDMECKTEPKWVKDESSIQEIDLGCNTEPEWLVDESHGDKLYVSSPEGRLFSFDSCSSKVCWSVSTGIAAHASYQHICDKLLLDIFSSICMRCKPQDAEVLFMDGFRHATNVVCSTSVTKRHVIPRRVSLPLTLYSAQKLKEATTDSPSDITLCIKLFDYHLTYYRPRTNIIELKLRHATSIISIVSRDAVRRHEKNDVPARQGQYLLTPGRHCNLTWSGKDDKNTVLVGGHDLGADVIYIEKGQSDDDAVKKEVSIVSAACNGNLNVLKVYDVKSDQDFYEVSTERCGKGLREFILSSRKDHKILMKLISGIVTGIARLHDKGIFLGNLDLDDISVDEDYNAKISIISTKTKFPLISSSKGATGCVNFADDMLVVGHVIFFGYTGVEYKGEDLTKPKPSDDYLNTLYDSPKALDLLRKLLNEDRTLGPTAAETYSHSVFWDPDTEFSFFRKVRVRLREEDPSSDLLKAIENIKPDVFVERWDTYINGDLLKEMNKHCRYNYWRVRDLIRFIRNDATYNSKRSGIETDIDTYFPELVIKLYEVMKTHCGEELAFKRYFKRTPVAT